MKYIILLSKLLFAILFLSNCTNNKNVAANNIVNEDSLMAAGYMNKGFDLQQLHPDSGVLWLEKGFAIAKEKHIPREVFNYYLYRITNLIEQKNDFNKAAVLVEGCMAEASKTDYRFGNGVACYCKALLFEKLEILDSSDVYYTKALKFLEMAEGGAAAVMDCYNNLAQVMYLQGDYLHATELTRYTLDFDLRKKDTFYIIKDYLKLYDIAAATGDSTLSKIYFDSAQQYNLNMPQSIQGLVYEKIGDDQKLKHLVAAGANYQLAISAYQQLNDSVRVAKGFLKMSSLMVAEKKMDAANVYLKNVHQGYDTAFFDTPTKLDYYNTYITIHKGESGTLIYENIVNRYIHLSRYYDKKIKSYAVAKNFHYAKRAVLHDQILQEQTKVYKKNQFIYWLIAGLGLLFLLLLLLLVYFKNKSITSKLFLKSFETEKELERLKTKVDTQLEERSRISQELHDELGASLTSISLAASILKDKIGAAKEIDIISSSSDAMVDKMNEIVWSLNNRNDNYQSLVAYIRKFAIGFLQQSNIEVSFTDIHDTEGAIIPGFIRRNLYFTVKEALHNIVKHAQAKKVDLKITLKGQHFFIDIVDDGKGMENALQSNTGNGLKNMEVNIKSIGGVIEWIASKGTSIKIQSPITIN
jgi:signal transduction histidine kinase